MGREVVADPCSSYDVAYASKMGQGLIPHPTDSAVQVNWLTSFDRNHYWSQLGSNLQMLNWSIPFLLSWTSVNISQELGQDISRPGQVHYMSLLILEGVVCMGSSPRVKLTYSRTRTWGQWFIKYSTCFLRLMPDMIDRYLIGYLPSAYLRFDSSWHQWFCFIWMRKTSKAFSYVIYLHVTEPVLHGNLEMFRDGRDKHF